MCKNFHIPCVCGIFVVSLRSLTLRLVTSRDPNLENIKKYLIEKHTQLLEDYERNYFSGRKCNSFVSPE